MGPCSSTMLRLYYLPVRARGEALRMLLMHAGINFEDRVLSFEEWQAGWKDKMPLNDAGERQVPVLELQDGSMMPESAKIAEYIARQAGAPPGQLICLSRRRRCGCGATTTPLTPHGARIGCHDWASLIHCSIGLHKRRLSTRLRHT